MVNGTYRHLFIQQIWAGNLCDRTESYEDRVNAATVTWASCRPHTTHALILRVTRWSPLRLQGSELLRWTVLAAWLRSELSTTGRLPLVRSSHGRPPLVHAR